MSWVYVRPKNSSWVFQDDVEVLFKPANHSSKIKPLGEDKVLKLVIPANKRIADLSYS